MIAMAEIEAESAFQPGERITHHEYGQGVVLDPVRGGYLRAFFGVGERRVPIASLQRQLSRTERILRAVAGGADRGRTAWLSCEAHALPVVESASALTSARISDVSSSLDRLVQFLCAAGTQRQQKMLKVDEQTYEVMTADGARRARFTLNRDSATNQDDLELLGLDHPLVQEELGRWRSVPPEDIGIAVAGGGGGGGGGGCCVVGGGGRGRRGGGGAGWWCPLWPGSRGARECRPSSAA